MLGRKYGYYPEDPEQGWLVDSTLDGLMDMFQGAVKARWEPDEEKKKQLMGEWLKDTLPKFLTVFEKRLSANSSPNFFVGDKLTIADFAWLSFIFSHVYNPEGMMSAYIKPIFENFPRLKTYAEALKTTFYEYLENRPKRTF